MSSYPTSQYKTRKDILTWFVTGTDLRLLPRTYDCIASNCRAASCTFSLLLRLTLLVVLDVGQELLHSRLSSQIHPPPSRTRRQAAATRLNTHGGELTSYQPSYLVVSWVCRQETKHDKLQDRPCKLPYQARTPTSNVDQPSHRLFQESFEFTLRQNQGSRNRRS